MDIVGKEALEQMLREYEGTVLFVSHDRYFISRIATGILEFSESGVKQYAMSYEEYLAEKQKKWGFPKRAGNVTECAAYGRKLHTNLMGMRNKIRIRVVSKQAKMCRL